MIHCVFTKTVTLVKWYLIMKRTDFLKKLNPQTTLKCTASHYNPIQFL